MTRISKDDLRKYLADEEDQLPEDRRRALETEIDRVVTDVVDALPRAEPGPGFDRAVFARIDAIDAQVKKSYLERLRAWLMQPWVGWPAAAAVAASAALLVLWPRTSMDDLRLELVRGDTMELAENLELYEDLELLENLDVLNDLELIESLDPVEAG